MLERIPYIKHTGFINRSHITYAGVGRDRVFLHTLAMKLEFDYDSAAMRDKLLAWFTSNEEL